MTNKTKMSNLESFQELSIQISCLDMKLDAILKLLNQPNAVTIIGDVSVTGTLESTDDYDLTKPYRFDFEPIQTKINKEIKTLFDAYKKVGK